MSKLLSFALAVLLVSVAGLAFATNIPNSVDPKNYPIIWTETVYNGGTSAIATAHVVQWDFDTSDTTPNYYDDMCPWVKLADAAEDIWTAGVTLHDRNIPAGSTGTIIIKGPAIVYDGGNTVTANQLAATDASGQANAFAGGANDECTIGRTIKASATQQGYTQDALVYIEPVCFDEN